MGLGGFGNLSYPSAPFNYLNRKGMRIVSNKQGEVGMGATHPKPAPLSSLYKINTSITIQETQKNKK